MTAIPAAAQAERVTAQATIPLAIPAMFHLQPIGDFHDHPLGTEFDVVYCPEATTFDGWVIIHYRTVDFLVPHNRQWSRCIAHCSKTPITEAEAAQLWADACEREMTP